MTVGALVIAVNPDPESKLGYLIRVPLGPGLVFRTSGTWPRTKALFCYPVGIEEWPDNPEIVEEVPVRSCARRGGAIDLVLDRARENRSQLVFTRGRGREMVFWQSPRTRKQARPNVRTPTARAAGIAGLEILVDTREKYGYRFAGQQVTTVKRALPSGDYGITVDGEIAAVVERKSLTDLVSSLTGGTLRFALGELAAVPRAAIVVEDRYSQIFKLDRIRPAVVADGLAELQVRWPQVPILFLETRQLAEEFTYRYLAAAHTWAADEHLARERIECTSSAAEATGVAGDDTVPENPVTPSVEPTAGEVRAWARATGLPVSDRGRLRPEIWLAWRDANTSPRPR